MSIDLVLKAACERCGSTSDLYGTNCKHTTLCLSCGKAVASSRGRCHLCAAPVTNLIREYNVRASANTDKNFYIGRFATGLPPFSKKKNVENKWTLHKEGLQGRQLTDSLKEKYKNKPWILEDETGQHQFQGQIEGSQSATATYYLLMLQGKEFVAYPAGSWYNFNKIAQYKQLTLEEAEEKMNKRRSNADGYERWLMKAATNGAAAFGETKSESLNNSGAEGNRSKKGKGLDDKDHSDKGDQDEEEEEDRKSRLGLSKKSVDDDEGGGKGADFDLDDDDIEKGDDWEHEEVFTDDDEAVGNDPEEKEDLAPDIPAPPEIKQDEEDENEEEDGELSKSGKELKKLLGKAAGLNESDAEDDDDDDDEDDVGMSPVLAPKKKENIKDEPAENTPAKATAPNGSTRATPAASKSSKAKRKPGNDDQKVTNNAPAKKAKAEHSGVKDEPTSAKPNIPMKPSASTASKSGPASSTTTSSTLPVTEDEIRNVLRAHAPVTTQDLVAKFKARLKSQEDKKAFADILRGMSKIQKINGHSYVVLRDK